MTTVINNPGDGTDSSSSIIVGVIVLIIVGALFFIYALPSIRNGSAAPAPQNGSVDLNVKLPTGGNTTGGDTGGNSAPAPGY